VRQIEQVTPLDPHAVRKMVAEPEQVDHLHFVPVFEKQRREHGTDVTGAARNQYFHGIIPFENRAS